MIVGLGVDVVAIDRVARAIERPRFLERVFLPSERERIAQKGAQTAAGCFAAKEAVAKALGTGFRGFMIWDIEIVADDLGRPDVRLLGGAKARFLALLADSMHISISHADGVACAVCVIERNGGSGI